MASILDGMARCDRGHWVRRGVPRAQVAQPGERGWGLSADDVREFLLAYCACFMAVSTFLL